jgi:hypothetical protein
MLLAGCVPTEVRQEPPAQAPVAVPVQSPVAPPAPAPVVAPPAADPKFVVLDDKAAREALTVELLKELPPDGHITIRAHLRNPTGREIKPVVSWEATGTSWQGERVTTPLLAPGGEGVIEVHTKVGAKLFPLPRAKIEIVDGTHRLYGWSFLADALAGIGPMVREWNVVGPFDLGLGEKTDAERNDKTRNLPPQRDFVKGRLPGWENPLPPEKQVDLGTMYPGKAGKRTSWEPIKAGPSGLVDLAAHFTGDDTVACAVSYIHSPKGGKHEFTCGSDDSIRVAINGKEVWKKHAERGAACDADVFSADLKQGWNEVLVKLAHRSGDWGFYFRVIDPERALKFALRPAAGDKR